MDEDETPTAGDLAHFNTIRVETALSRYPVHRLARKGSIEINIREGNSRGGESSWEVDYSKKHGQPGPLAYKLDTLIINRRIEEATRPIPRILRLGSLSDICRELGLADSGKNRADIKKALFQNAFAGITARTRFRQGDGGEGTLEAAFTRYSVVLTGEKLPSGVKADAVHIILNDVFIRVINGAMTRPLDYDYLRSLSPAPQRFYELLSYRMYAALLYDRSHARLHYSELCAHAPQARHTDWNKVRSQMGKIHRPHLQSGYIAEVEWRPASDEGGRPDWIFSYRPGPKARAEFTAFNKRGGPNVLEVEPLEPPMLDGIRLSELELELVRRGITDTVARQLVAEHPEEKIRLQIEVLDWRMGRKGRPAIDDPAAYLVSAIQTGGDGHAVPRGFVSAAERRRREEAGRAREQKDAEECRRRAEEEARRRRLEQDVEAYIRRLGPAERAAHEAAALAAAGPETRESYARPGMAKFRDTLMLGMLRDHVRAMLDVAPAEG